MGTQRVNYRNASDTGERDDPEAISPIQNGERVIENVTNRPGENIRNRTESARSHLEDQMYLSDTDMKWTIRGGHIEAGPPQYMAGDVLPAVTAWTPEELGAGPPWSSPLNPYRGEFVIDSPIVLEGVLSPGTDLSHVERLYAENAAPPRSYTVYLTSRYQAAAGGDIIRIRWRYDDDALVPFPSGYLSVYATGGPVHVINVDVAGDGSVTLQQVEAALALDAAITNLVTITNDGGDTGTVLDIADLAYPAAGERSFEREVQRELHRIAPGTLAGFFATNPAGAPYPDPYKLKDGDTLGIRYPYIEDPDAFFGPHADPTQVGGRRQATLTNNAIPLAAPVEIDPSQLFNSTYYPEYVAQAIPICKRIGDDLVFIDGTIIEGLLDPLDPLYPIGGIKFGEHGHTVARIMGAASSISVPITENWYGGVPLSGGPTWTIEQAVNAIIADLALVDDPGNDSGSRRVGVDKYDAASPGPSVAGWTYPTGSVRDIFTSLVGAVGACGALAFNETVSGDWTFTGNNHFRNTNTFDTTWYHRSSGATAVDLLYSFNPWSAVSPSHTYWNSYRCYHDNVTGALLHLYGCDYDTSTTVKAARDDVGTGGIAVVGWDGDGFVSWYLEGATANTVYTVRGDPTSYYHKIGNNGILGTIVGQHFTPLAFSSKPINPTVDEDVGFIDLQASRQWGGTPEPKLFAHVARAPSGTFTQDATLYYINEDAVAVGPNITGSVFIKAQNCRWDPVTSAWVRTEAGIYASIEVTSIFGTKLYTSHLGSYPASWCAGSSVHYDDVGAGSWDDVQYVTATLPTGISTRNNTDTWGPSVRVEGVIPGGPTPYSQVISSDIDWRNRYVEVRAFISADDITGKTSVETAFRNSTYACHLSCYFGDGGAGNNGGVWGTAEYDLHRHISNAGVMTQSPLTSPLQLGVDPVPAALGALRLGYSLPTPGDWYFNIYLTPTYKKS